MEVEGVGWRWYWGGRRVRDGVGRGRREGGREVERGEKCESPLVFLIYRPA